MIRLVVGIIVVLMIVVVYSALTVSKMRDE